MPAFVALDAVSHSYGGAGGTLAVEGLTISVDRGEFAAVVGPSGCGKSTLMKLATGLQFPFKGTVQVAGERVSKPVKIAGMAFQAPTLLPWRTTLENLLLPLEIVEPHRSQIRRRKSDYVARAEKLLASVGLDGQGGKYPWELSGGMQSAPRSSRVTMSRALMLDEPFGALDAFHARIVLVFATFRREQSTSCSHQTCARRRPSDRSSHVVAAGTRRCRTPRRAAAAARSGGDVQAGIPEHRARAARAHRTGTAMSPALSVRLAPWIYTLALLVIWEASVHLFRIPEFFLPPPTAVAVRSTFWPRSTANS